MSRVVWGISFVWAVLLVWVMWGLYAARPGEQTAYTVAERRGDYEIRVYPEQMFAQVNIRGLWSSAHDEGSRILGEYLAGNNFRPEVFAMARPIGVQQRPERELISEHAPVLMQETGGAFLVSVPIPAEYTFVTLPRPNNPEIRIKKVPSRTVAVRTFNGWVDQTRVKGQETLLRELLAQDNRVIVSAAAVAQYSPQWTPPFLRRNEILIPVTSKP